MEKRIGKRSMSKVVAAAVVGLAGFGVSQANASLIVDVRATAVNGAPVSNAKSIEVNAGDVVTVKMFGVVTGANDLNDESMQTVHGSFISGGNLLGNLGNHVLNSTFAGSGSSPGSNIDLDLDGDLDIGQPNGGVVDGFSIYRSSAQVSGTPVTSGSEELELGTMQFTADASVAPGQSTILDFFRRRTATGGNAQAYATWVEDGTPYSGTSGDKIGGSGLLIQSVVPEPTGLALAGLAALGLLGRRRNNA